MAHYSVRGACALSIPHFRIQINKKMARYDNASFQFLILGYNTEILVEEKRLAFQFLILGYRLMRLCLFIILVLLLSIPHFRIHAIGAVVGNGYSILSIPHFRILAQPPRYLPVPLLSIPHFRIQKDKPWLPYQWYYPTFNSSF